MNSKIFFLIGIMFFSNLLLAQDFENSQLVPQYSKYISKFNVANTLSIPPTTSTSRQIVCEGTQYDLDSFTTKSYTFSNMEIKTICNNDPTTDKICAGYEPGTSPKNGAVVLINNNEMNNYVDYYKAHFQYSGGNNAIEKLFKQNNLATLSKFYIGSGGIDVNTRGRTGVGCMGTYNYQIRQGGTTISGGTFTGALQDNLNVGYTFNTEGNYEIVYSTSINRCISIYEEKYVWPTDKTKVIHPFTQETKSTAKINTKTLYVQVIDDDGPDFTAPSGNVNCGLIYSGGIITLPPVLIQGESVIIPTTMRITNVYDVPINVTRVNAKFYNILTYPIWNQQPTGDIVVNSITTDPLIVSGFPFFVELQINPGQTRTIRVYINATVTTDTPDESYNLRMDFDYEYPTPSHGCYLGDNDVGYCSGPITVDVVETPEEPEPVITRVLRANVSVTPQLIDIPFIEAGRDTVNVSGRVNFTTYNTSGTPPVTTVTTTYPNGARVELISLILGGAIECLDSVVPVNITSNGHYKFTNVKLNEECLKYEINEQLVGTIDVEYTFNNTLYTNTSTGNSSVNTMIPPLECEIFYDMEGTNPESEKYNITVQIYHGIDMQRIIYTCGLEDMEQADLNGADEYEFNCEYEFKEEEDTEYIVQVIVRDNENLRTVWEASCTANVGLCLPYV